MDMDNRDIAQDMLDQQRQKDKMARHAANYTSGAAVGREKTGREKILHEALEITAHDRNKAYGNPEDNFQNIADVWNWYLADRIKHGTLVLEGVDIAHMQGLMKYARLKNNRLHKDSIVDVAGYAACAGDFVKPKDTEQQLKPGTASYPEIRGLAGQQFICDLSKFHWVFSSTYWNTTGIVGHLEARSIDSWLPQNMPKSM